MVNIRNFMDSQGIKYLLVNATNEFLLEYNKLEENSRYKLTGFSGSTGEALVTPQTIFLFVDGRYHIQADLEVNHDFVTVVKLQSGQDYLEELLNKIPQDETLGIFSKKNSQYKVEKISSKRNIKFLETDPYDCSVRISTNDDIQIGTKYCGVSSEEKINKIAQNLSDNEAIYVTDLDEVSYLFNKRNFSQCYSAKIKAKAIIFKDNAILFTQDKLNDLEEFLQKLDKDIYVDKKKINAYDYNLLSSHAKELKSNPISIMKSIKNDTELEHLKDAFERTDKVVNAIRDYIYNNEGISEFDIAVELAKEFKNQGALGLSFSSIVARNKNSALAHYSGCSKDEIVKNGDLVLIDCGGYFEGGLATDITRVFVKGEPCDFQKKIYTNVLKAFLNAFNYLKKYDKTETTGYAIDKSVRDLFDTSDLDGFVFNHGLGHGLGVNVHEYPPKLSADETSKVQLIDGECFTIEPGLYKEGFFGVRLENSCYLKDKQIHSFAKMNFEQKLIKYELLSEQERLWLNDFEVK